MKQSVSPIVIVAGVVALACLGLAGVLLIQAGPESTQRLGLFFAVISVGVTAFAALLKADTASTNTNGNLDQRIEDGVHRALAGRRTTDGAITRDPHDADAGHGG